MASLVSDTHYDRSNNQFHLFIIFDSLDDVKMSEINYSFFLNDDH